MKYFEFNALPLQEASSEVSPCPLISHPNSDPHCDLRGAAAAEVLLQKMLLSRRIVRVYNLRSCSVPPFRSRELCTSLKYKSRFIPNEPHLPQDGQRSVSYHNQDDDSFTTGSKYTQRGVLEVRSPRAVAR